MATKKKTAQTNEVKDSPEVEKIKAEIQAAQQQLQQYGQMLQQVNQQRENIVAEINAHQGVIRYLTAKLPKDEQPANTEG